MIEPRSSETREPSPDAYDSPWKDMLELYLEDFFLFFFPHMHREIDWS